ncbi:MAG: alpha/beta hydrolase, partial [Ignavibacteriales bacterium]|nr:alpha/beta hydrolase [Ignavibacteriales bacterium]
MRIIIQFVTLLLIVSSSLSQLTETADWTVQLSSQYRVIPNIVYSVANNYECKLDVYARRGDPAPVVIYIHGGGWVAGTK